MLGNKFGNSLALLNNLTTFAIKPEMSEILDVKITSGHNFSIYLKEHIANIVALNIWTFTLYNSYKHNRQSFCIMA